MDTYILLGIGFGLGLLIAIRGIWNLRESPLLVVGLCLDLTGSVEWTVHAQSKSGRSPVREAVLRDVGRWLCRTAMQRT